jgi:cytochrome c oxidase subunit 3
VSVDVDDAEEAGVRGHADALGLWVFLASEAMFFAGLLLVCGVARAFDAAAFARGVALADRGLGTVNTLELLTSSACVAGAVHALEHQRRRAAVGLVLATAGLAGVFLVIKGVEYAGHVDAGLLPRGVSPYWTLYWICTAIHAVHVFVGAGLLVVCALAVARGDADDTGAGRLLENVALFWHFVDVVWILLWPLFYLVKP